jgi:flavin-dependent dehydrogenase
MDNEFDVVIVGGGPVGLWLACELALAKVKVVVLERRTERVVQSRALASPTRFPASASPIRSRCSRRPAIGSTVMV